LDWSNLKTDYERLGTYAAVAAEYGVSVSTVGQEARRQKVNRGYANQNSPLEKLLQSALRQVGIGFTTQAHIAGRFFADVLINQAPVVIEADGHWHKLQQERDAKRDAAMAAAGYRVFRFTGAQLNRGADECVQQVIRACGLVPDEEPEYVIRVSMLGRENPNWTGGLTSLPCERCGGPTPGRSTTYAYEKRFCGHECRGQWMSEHPEASPRRLKIDWSELPTLYQGGMPFQELQARYDCSRNTIHRQLGRMGIDPRRRRPGAPVIYTGQFSEKHRANIKAAAIKRAKEHRNTPSAPRSADGRFVASKPD
jgi:very-short-patch-repair endonuclease